MPEREIMCPSGLRGTVRGLRGKELDLFANKQEIQKRRVSRKILNNCWVDTQDFGAAYPGLNIEDRIDFDKILMCDRFYALLQIRIATHGPAYNFRVQCSSDSCRKRYEWELNIDELSVYELPEESIHNFKNDNIFQTSALGDTVHFKLLTGADEQTTVQAQDLAPDKRATTSIIARVKQVDRADGGVLKDGGDLRRWAQDLDYGPTMDLVDAMDSVDGGVETDIEVQCPHCGNMEDIQLPLGEDFWSPRKRVRSKNRRVRRPNPVS